MAKKIDEEFGIGYIARLAIGNGNSIELKSSNIGPISVESPEPSRLLMGGGSPFIPLKKITLSSSVAYSKITDSISEAQGEFNRNLAATCKQSRFFFLIMCIFLILALILILLSFLLIVTQSIDYTIATTLSSALCAIVASTFMKIDKDLRNRIDRANEVQKTYVRFLTLIEVADTLSNLEERESMKERIIEAALNCK